MIFDLYQNNKKVGFGNPNMLKFYTDTEINDFYKRFNIEVKISRDSNKEIKSVEWKKLENNAKHEEVTWIVSFK